MPATTPDPDAPTFTLSAADPAAPFALLAYASALSNKGAKAEDVFWVRALAQEFYRWQDTHGVIELGRSVLINDKIENMFKGERDL